MLTARALRRPIGAVSLVLALLTWCSQASAADPSWRWPLEPRPTVVRGYDPPDEPWAAGHRGVDLHGSVGQQVLAVAAGRVTYAGVVAGRGVVSVRHGELRSTYEPVVALVDAGDTVWSGAPIGTLTSVGSHCLPQACLHLGAKLDGAYVDPLDLLGAQPVRLKPLEEGGPGSGNTLATGAANAESAAADADLAVAQAVQTGVVIGRDVARG